MPDHDEAANNGTRDLDLPDGRFYAVDERLHPFLKEWDWRYDDSTHQIVRDEEGRTVYLLHEEIRWHRKAGPASPKRPTLSRLTVRTMFGHYPEFREMLLLSMKQREHLLYTVGCTLPNPTELLADVYTEAFLLYFEWLEKADTFVFRPDPERLIPGEIASAPRTERPAYRTLGDWMDGELTGRWSRDFSAATGIGPETYAKRIDQTARQKWHRFVKMANWDEIASQDLESILWDSDFPVRDLCRNMVTLLRRSPLP